jgi:hypothetical protein
LKPVDLRSRATIGTDVSWSRTTPHPTQLVDRALDPVPEGPAFHVAGRHQLVGTLGGM